MLGSLIIVFREVIEAGLIVGIVLAVTHGVPRRGRWITAGVAAGVLGATLVAAFANVLSNAMAGMGQELFDSGILIIAVIMLSWHNIWMARHGREIAEEIRAVGQAVSEGSRSLAALAIVVAIAVLREGSEIVLFLYGLAAAGGATAAQLLIGAALGLAAGCAVSALTFFSFVSLPTRYLFSVTTTLITFLAAGLASQAVLLLQQAGIITTGMRTAWDTSFVLRDSSLIGRVLHTLVGYSDQPSEMQVLAYVLTLAAIFCLTWLLEAPKQPKPAVVTALPPSE